VTDGRNLNHAFVRLEFLDRPLRVQANGGSGEANGARDCFHRAAIVAMPRKSRQGPRRK
jgi:hypothetical protein